MNAMTRGGPPGIRGGALAGLLMALAVAGCSVPSVPMPQGTIPAPATSAAFDGRYSGSLQVAGAATGLDPKACSPPPGIGFDVREGRFSLTVTHPEAGLTSPDLRQKSVVVYQVLIAPDGTVNGLAEATNTNLVGRVSGTRMTGRIDGLLCSYTFTADRA